MKPRFTLRPMALALGAALGTGLSVPAQCDILAVGGTTDFKLQGGFEAKLGQIKLDAPPSAVDFKFAKVSPDAGVITGIEFKFFTQYSQSLSGTSTALPGTSKFKFVGDSSSKIGLLLPAVQKVREAAIQGSCTGGSISSSCSFETGRRTQGFGDLLEVPEESLNRYIGKGTVIGTASVSDFDLQASGTGIGKGHTSIKFEFAGRGELDFKFHKHADPSFKLQTQDSALKIKFEAHGASGEFKFFQPAAVFNLGGEDAVGLDFDGIVDAQGDTTVLGLDLDKFSGLAPGEGKSFLAILHGNAPGNYRAEYKLKFSDADVGASASRLEYFATVELSGRVVPEPGSWALMLGGLGGIAWAVPRRRSSG